jgi:hypothetical protein
MHLTTLLVTFTASLVSANPMAGAEPGDPSVNTNLNALNSHTVWKLDLMNDKWCKDIPDATLSSESGYSRCLKYNDGLGKEVESIRFHHPKGDKNCQVS